MVKDFFDLTGKIILVTGAGGKLGSHYCDELAKRGAKVIGLDITEQNAANNSSSNIYYYQCDITRKESLFKLYEELKVENNLPNVLINNAAAGQVTFIEGDLVEFTEFPTEVWEANLSVNLTGALNILQVFGKYLESINEGSIINISSTYGVVGCDQRIYGDSRLNSSIAYAATKSGLIGMTRYLAAYWGESNIRVNALAPGGVFNNHKDPFLSNYLNKTMIKRMGTKDDILAAIIYLASDASSWVTGSVMMVDGGFTAW